MNTTGDKIIEMEDGLMKISKLKNRLENNKKYRKRA